MDKKMKWEMIAGIYQAMGYATVITYEGPYYYSNGPNIYSSKCKDLSKSIEAMQIVERWMEKDDSIFWNYIYQLLKQNHPNRTGPRCWHLKDSDLRDFLLMPAEQRFQAAYEVLCEKKEETNESNEN